MPQVLVWKCPHTGKLFEDKSKYTAHLRKAGRERARQRKLAQAARDWDEFNTRMGQECKTFDEMLQFIRDNWERFYLNGAKQNLWRKSSRTPEPPHRLVDIEIEYSRWTERLGNTHSCPRGGVENWRQTADKPCGYPGWNIRIDFRLDTGKHKYRGKEFLREGYGSDYFATSIIRTGTGGGGSGKDAVNYGYSCDIWAHDWPAMYVEHRKKEWIKEENRRRNLAWQALGGTAAPPQVTDVPADWVCPELPPLKFPQVAEEDI